MCVYTNHICSWRCILCTYSVFLFLFFILLPFYILILLSASFWHACCCNSRISPVCESIKSYLIKSLKPPQVSVPTPDLYWIRILWLFIKFLNWTIHLSRSPMWIIALVPFWGYMTLYTTKSLQWGSLDSAGAGRHTTPCSAWLPHMKTVIKLSH